MRTARIALVVTLLGTMLALSPSSVIQYLALHGDLQFPLWESTDRWLTTHHMTARWIVEPWSAFVDDQHGIRHMSNAGLASSNPGVNAYFGLVSLTFR